MADLQAIFVRHLQRAERFQQALAQPLPGRGVETAVFGGDCELTPGRAVFESSDGQAHLAFRASDVLQKLPGVDYDRLLLEPGDGLVPRASQVGRLEAGPGQEAPPALFATAQTFFLCESHQQLSTNPYFQNNLLYFLLAR